LCGAPIFSDMPAAPQAGARSAPDPPSRASGELGSADEARVRAVEMAAARKAGDDVRGADRLVVAVRDVAADAVCGVVQPAAITVESPP
jgi:hypothetical protein